MCMCFIDRDCSSGTFFLPVGEVRRCVDQCAPQTMCGPIVVPEDHLKVVKIPPPQIFLVRNWLVTDDPKVHYRTQWESFFTFGIMHSIRTNAVDFTPYFPCLLHYIFASAMCRVWRLICYLCHSIWQCGWQWCSWCWHCHLCWHLSCWRHLLSRFIGHCLCKCLSTRKYSG